MRPALRIALIGTLAAGCGSDAPAPGPTAAEANPGTPLEIRTAPPTAAAPCTACGQPGGPQHRCGQSQWCATCGVDAAPRGHTCRVSRFCTGCGFEAAIAGHRCGTTRFDAARNADVERDDLDEEHE